MFKQHSTLFLIISFLFIVNTGYAQVDNIPCDSSGKKAICRNYYPETGQLKSLRIWKKGLRHGSWLILELNGDPQRLTAYRKGEWLFTEYYVRGKRSKRIYPKGKVVKYPDCGCH